MRKWTGTADWRLPWTTTSRPFPTRRAPLSRTFAQPSVRRRPRPKRGISYRVPTYRYHGPLVHFAAFKDHCSFIVASASVVERFKNELEGYEISGTTIQFLAKNPLSPDLVDRIVRARMKENEARSGRKRI